MFVLLTHVFTRSTKLAVALVNEMLFSADHCLARSTIGYAMRVFHNKLLMLARPTFAPLSKCLLLPSGCLPRLYRHRGEELNAERIAPEETHRLCKACCDCLSRQLTVDLSFVKVNNWKWDCRLSSEEVAEEGGGRGRWRGAPCPSENLFTAFLPR